LQQLNIYWNKNNNNDKQSTSDLTDNTTLPQTFQISNDTSPAQQRRLFNGPRIFYQPTTHCLSHQQPTNFHKTERTYQILLRELATVLSQRNVKKIQGFAGGTELPT
jgi:hypothetical protein